MNLSDFNKSPKIDKVGVHEIVSRFCKRSIKTSSKKHGLHLVLSMIDLTTLEGKDTPEKVNYPKMVQVVAGLTRAVAEMASSG